ncbi:hypothetical protein [Haemophilus sputorum]
MHIEQELIKLEEALYLALEELDLLEERAFSEGNKLSEAIEESNRIGDYDFAYEQQYISEECEHLMDISRRHAEEIYAHFLDKQCYLAQKNSDEERISFDKYFTFWKLNKK